VLYTKTCGGCSPNVAHPLRRDRCLRLLARNLQDVYPSPQPARELMDRRYFTVFNKNPASKSFIRVLNQFVYAGNYRACDDRAHAVGTDQTDRPHTILQITQAASINSANHVCMSVAKSCKLIMQLLYRNARAINETKTVQSYIVARQTDINVNSSQYLPTATKIL
jgi:hypothetical protein